jgi:pimeloyl-ACP methyl ester carboxylesterase
VQITDWQAAERSLTVSHGEATYIEAGDEGPPVLLLHGVGFTQGAHDWLFNVEALARDFRVVAVDLVGWGRGTRLRQGYSFARLVDFVREFQDALEIPASHVIGHSMGGWIASLLAYESPQRVDRLVLVGSGGISTRPLPMMTAFEPPTLAETEASVAARTIADPETARAWARYGWENVQRPEALQSYRRILAHMTDPETRCLYNTRRRLPYVTAPTLVLWGSGDTVNRLKLGRETADLIPDGSLTVLDGGHFLPSERPSEFNGHVARFLHGDQG